VPYSPLSCVSDQPVAVSPSLPQRTSDSFALPSVSVKTRESVGEAVQSVADPPSPKLQQATAAVQLPSDSNVDVKCSSSAMSNAAIGDDGIDKKSTICLPPDLLSFDVVNVFSSEEEKNQVIDDVSA